MILALTSRNYSSGNYSYVCMYVWVFVIFESWRLKENKWSSSLIYIPSATKLDWLVGWSDNQLRFCYVFALNLIVYLTGFLFLFCRQPKPPPKRRSVWPIKNVVAHYIGKGDIFGNMTAGMYCQYYSNMVVVYLNQISKSIITI